MFEPQKSSTLAQRLKVIVDDLNRDASVQCAVLSTEDGLAVDNSTVTARQLAAVSGFMLAAARQSCAMLGIGESQEIILRQANGHFVVCRSFWAGNIRLVLVLVFEEKTAYRRLVSRTVRKIRQAVEV